MMIKDENGHALIGYVNLGTHLVPRAKLAAILPDIERFERCLDDAVGVDQYMTDHGGAVPPIVGTWSHHYRQQVAATVHELGDLAMDAANELREEAKRRGIA